MNHEELFLITTAQISSSLDASNLFRGLFVKKWPDQELTKDSCISSKKCSFRIFKILNLVPGVTMGVVKNKGSPK